MYWYMTVKLVNAAINNAKAGSRESRLRCLPHVADPSSDVQEVLIQCMDWNMKLRWSRFPEEELPDSEQEKAVALLDLLQEKLPDKTGEKAKWNFEKAHTASQHSAQGLGDHPVGQFL
jgi:hypothetical protein